MEERIISDQPLPQWVQEGMNAVLLAPSAKNTQKVMFKYENNILSAQTADDYSMDLIDLGIAKKLIIIWNHGSRNLTAFAALRLRSSSSAA